MNCEKLHSDIEKLKSLRDELKDKYDVSVESGLGKTALQNLSERVFASADEVLEEYLDDFYEHNKNSIKEIRLGNRIEEIGRKSIYSITELQDGSFMIRVGADGLYCATKDESGKVNLGERIEEFKNHDGSLVVIGAITELRDGSMLIEGDNGFLYHVVKDENGKIRRLNNSISGRFVDRDGDSADIHSITELSDGSIMIGGSRGALYHATKNEHGKIDLGDLIYGIKEDEDGPVNINSITELRDSSILIGGDEGALYRAAKDDNGKIKLGGLITGFLDRDGDPADIHSITELSDESIMIGGGFGVLYCATRYAGGRIHLGFRKDGFNSSGSSDWTDTLKALRSRNTSGANSQDASKPADISSIVELDDGSIILGGLGSFLYRVTKGEYGEINLNEQIEGFKNFKGGNANVNAITKLRDGSIMIGRGFGALYNATFDRSLVNLKDSLDKIIQSQVNR